MNRREMLEAMIDELASMVKYQPDVERRLLARVNAVDPRRHAGPGERIAQGEPLGFEQKSRDPTFEAQRARRPSAAVIERGRIVKQALVRWLDGTGGRSGGF